ncbi:MAG: hemolysin III family protein [Myxococcota bacterium]
MNLDPSRPRSAAEERANVISHAIGLVLAIVGTVALVAVPLSRGFPERAMTCGVFGATAIATFLTSTVYHSLKTERARQLWLRLDYSAIYLLIAGTYTPLALTLLTPEVGWGLFAMEWLLALGGIILVFAGREPSTAFYVALGAGGVAVLPALIFGIPLLGLLLLAAGGACYIGGAAFYVAERIPYNHLVWHIAVIAGVGFHYAAVFRYVAIG